MHRLPRTRNRPVCVCLAAMCCLLAAGGCVQRRLTIRSNPPGALVYIDNYEIGVTPVATDFIYYGTREIRVVKDGYQTQTRMQPIPAPWYQYFPLDFVAENVVPYEIRDERLIDFQLVPLVVVPTDAVLRRADQLRAGQGLPPPTPPYVGGPQAPPDLKVPR